MLVFSSWHALAEAALTLKGWVCGAETTAPGVLIRVVACCSGPLFLRLATLQPQRRAWTA